MIQLRVICHLSSQAKPKLNLIFQLPPPKIRVDLVAIDLRDCNQELEDSTVLSMGLPILLNCYGMHLMSIMVVYTVLDLAVVVINLRIFEIDLPSIGPIIENTYLVPAHITFRTICSHKGRTQSGSFIPYM